MFYDIGRRIWLTTEVNEGFPIGLLQVRIPFKILSGWKITDILHSIFVFTIHIKRARPIYSICLPLHLSICPSVSANTILHSLTLVCPFVYLAICLSGYMCSHSAPVSPPDCTGSYPFQYFCRLKNIHSLLFVTIHIKNGKPIWYICLPVHLSIYPSCLSVCLSDNLSISLCVQPFSHLSPHLIVHLPTACLFIYLYVHTSVYLVYLPFVCQYIPPSVY